MDTVYGTKKYFQSLSGASDIYRSQTCRGVSNDYSYQNTLGRRSQLGSYYHMNQQPSFTNERSIANQYGYNTWGIWRDGRNVAPSTFSAKTHRHYQKNRSFSIILTTAAFILLLAVISIAGLAFYFSSIKANMEEPIFGFEGSFRIAKGDLFSTGLKYNHTTTYKQKIEYYKRFVERALSDNGLQPLRTDVWGFGDGPLIKVSFRVFLDVRKLPQTIHSVEEYIKESLFLETSATKSLYRSLRIDPESVEIKRLMDDQILRTAELLKDAQTVPISQTQLEKHLTKKAEFGSSQLQGKSTNSSTQRPRTTARPHSIDDEPDVDVENAPVIQGSFEGSFEITKTDADIARKKATPTRAYHSDSSMSPKIVTPYSLRVKPKKPAIEKLSTITPHPHSKSSTTPKFLNTTTTPIPRATSTKSTSIKTSKKTTQKPATTTTSSTTTTTTTTTSTTTSTTEATTTLRPSTIKTTPDAYTISTLTVPKLDANLFTTIPILDTQPWRPIHREVSELLPGPPPSFPTKPTQIAHSQEQSAGVASLSDLHQPPQRRIDEFELPFMPENPLPPVPPSFDTFANGLFTNIVRKHDFEEANGTEKDMTFYHSFGSQIFMPDTENIERLGASAHVQPHPLPVPLIDDVVIPPFKPLNPTLGTMEKLPFNIEAGDEKFEHLGGGVIVKKQENSSKTTEATTPKNIIETPVSTVSMIASTTTLSPDKVNKSTNRPQADIYNPTDNSELADTIGEFFMELLNLPKEDIRKNTNSSTSTIEPDSLESRIALDDTQNSEAQINESLSEPTTSTAKPNFLNLKEIILKRNQAISKNATTTTQSPLTKRNRIRPASKRPPAIVDDSSLFPLHSKWEFVNSSSATGNLGHTGNMRKVFNKTLQAWVSEDVEKTENLTLNDIKTRINNASNIQDISLIFDTLASKLGITPSAPTKFPPFSQNKLKNSQKNESKQRVTSTKSPTTTTPFNQPQPQPMNAIPTESTTMKQFVELQLQHREPFIKPMSTFMSDISGSSSQSLGAVIPLVGEAEVEVIDPNKYEEMLKFSQYSEPSTTEQAIHKLVTLLPVRSNSGIRTNKPLSTDLEEQSQSGVDESITNEGRRFSQKQTPAEAVVKGGLKVTVK